MRVTLTRKSGNKKTGPIPVSTTERRSCPVSCPLRNAGCYAEDYPLRFHWDRIVERTHPDSWQSFIYEIRSLPPRTLWRHNQAGDLPGCGDRINARKLAQLVAANRGRRGFTYTHKPVLSGPHAARNRAAIANSNNRGFTINLSANNLHEADKLSNLAIAPVVVLLPTDAPALLTTPAGKRVVACPAQTEGLTCAACKLCQLNKSDRAIIGFYAHGNRARFAEALARSC